MSKLKTIKKAIITLGVSSILGVSGSYTHTLNDINSFQSDLEIMGIETEQAKNLSEYFFGNRLVGKKESISISEMQAIVNVYNKLEVKNFGPIKSEKDLLKKLNREVSKLAKKEKNKQ